MHGPPRKGNFVIFAHARSGSSTLKAIFNDQDSISVSGEPFNPDTKGNYVSYVARHGAEAAIRDIFSKFDGMKQLCGYLTVPENTWLIQNHRTIFLRRRNMFEAALSYQLAVHVDIWAATDEKKYSDVEKFPRLDPRKIKQWEETFNRNMDEYEPVVNRHNGLRVWYEDLYQDDREKAWSLVEEMFDFVGRKIDRPDRVHWWLDKGRKLNSEEVYRRLPNYEEIMRHA